MYPMEKAMASHSSTLAWKISWMEEPGGLQSMGLLRVWHDWATSLSCIGEGNSNPLQCSCLENPRDGGAWWAAIYGVSQSRTWLKWLSSSIHIPQLILSVFSKDGGKALPTFLSALYLQSKPITVLVILLSYPSTYFPRIINTATSPAVVFTSE